MRTTTLRRLACTLFASSLPLWACGDSGGGGGEDETSGTGTGTDSAGDDGSGDGGDGGSTGEGTGTGTDTGGDPPELDGFRIVGEKDNHQAATVIVGLGDVNGDGLGDVAVSAPSANGSDQDSGRAYVVFGRTDAAGGVINLVDVQAETDGMGYVIDGEGMNDTLGLANALANAGDINGDGINDIIVGAKNAVATGPLDPGGGDTGGDTTGTGTGTGTGTTGGGTTGGGTGGGGTGSLAFSGKAYVVFGKTDATKVTLATLEADGSGFTMDGGVRNERAGVAVAGGGDVNGDGTADLIVAAEDVSPMTGNVDYSGRVYVVFGKSDSTTVELEDVEAGNGGFLITGTTSDDRLGASVANVGDWNGDGLAEVAAGAPFANLNGSDSGGAFIVFGKADGTPVDKNDIIAGTGGFTLEGEAAKDEAGHSMKNLGDMNGDGLDDLAIGAVGWPDGMLNGKVYVVFGTATPVTLADVAAGTGGYAIEGDETGVGIGMAVGGGGDVDGDGIGDIVIGAPLAGMDGTAGRAYVVYGSDAATSAITLSDVTMNIGGWIFDQSQAGWELGTSVDTTSDINGDGVSEVLFGAPRVQAGAGWGLVFYQQLM